MADNMSVNKFLILRHELNRFKYRSYLT